MAAGAAGLGGTPEPRVGRGLAESLVAVLLAMRAAVAVAQAARPDLLAAVLVAPQRVVGLQDVAAVVAFLGATAADEASHLGGAMDAAIPVFRGGAVHAAAAGVEYARCLRPRH